MAIQTIHLGMCFNKAYLPGAYVTLHSTLSLLDQSFNARIHVIYNESDMSDAIEFKKIFEQNFSSAQLSLIQPDLKVFERCRRDYGGGYSAYARLLFGELIDADILVYLDADLLVQRDVSELLHMREGNWILAATPDVETDDGKPAPLDKDCPFADKMEITDYQYFNTGLLIMNLKAWREDNCFTDAKELVRTHGDQCRAWDQTVLNYLCRGRILSLDGKWLKSVNWENDWKNTNIHFVSRRKPWVLMSFNPLYTQWIEYFGRNIYRLWTYNLPAKQKIRNLVWYVRSFLFSYVPGCFSLYLVFLAVKCKPKDAVESLKRNVCKYRKRPVKHSRFEYLWLIFPSIILKNRASL